MFLQTFRNICVGTRAILLLSVALNDLRDKFRTWLSCEYNISWVRCPCFDLLWNPCTCVRLWPCLRYKYLLRHQHRLSVWSSLHMADISHRDLPRCWSPWFEAPYVVPNAGPSNSVAVNYCPRLLTEHPTEETHSIIADNEWGDRVVLHLCLSGVTSYITVCLLTDNEWNRSETLRVILIIKHLT